MMDFPPIVNRVQGFLNMKRSDQDASENDVPEFDVTIMWNVEEFDWLYIVLDCLLTNEAVNEENFRLSFQFSLIMQGLRIIALARHLLWHNEDRHVITIQTISSFQVTRNYVSMSIFLAYFAFSLFVLQGTSLYYLVYRLMNWTCTIDNRYRTWLILKSKA